jgi:hypothetical protein
MTIRSMLRKVGLVRPDPSVPIEELHQNASIDNALVDREKILHRLVVASNEDATRSNDRLSASIEQVRRTSVRTRDPMADLVYGMKRG